MIMKAGRYLKSLLLLSSLIFFLTSCTTTQLTSTWKSESHQDPIQKILVVVEARKEVGRRMAEDEIANDLKALGVEAIPGSQLISKGEDISKESVKEAIQGKGFDSVMLLRLISIDEEEEYVPPMMHFDPYYYRTPGLYHYDSGAMVDPGYTITHTMVVAESALFHTKNGEMIWSVVSKTTDPSSEKQMLDSMKKKVLANLQESGLLG
jgi:hypothetical protein